MNQVEATIVEEINVRPAPVNFAWPGLRAPVGRWMFLIICLFVVLVSSCLLSLQVPTVQRYLVRSWIENLDRRSGIIMRVKNFVWNWPATVTVREVEISLYGRKLVDCVEAAVTFGLSGASPFWYVKNVVLVRPVLYLEKDTAGRWVTPSLPPKTSRAGSAPDIEAPAGRFSQRITIRLDAGTILASQNGRNVLRVGDVSGQLTLPYDGGVGMRSLLANMEQLKLSAPGFMSLHAKDAGQRKEEGL
jgi:hypothetical protein